MASLIAILLLGSCSEPAAPTAQLDITPKDVTISVGSSQQFSALNAQGNITWSSSDPTVATVVSTGFATSLKSGSAQITVSDSRGSASTTLTVRSLAALALSQGTLSFTQQRDGSDPAAQIVQVSDAGDDKVGAVAVAGVTYDAGQPTGWLTATLSGAAAPAQLSIRAQAGTLPIGTYRAIVAVSAVGATNGNQNVVVNFTVTAPPAIQLSSTALTFNGLRGVGTVPAQSVNVTNSGGGTFSQLSAAVVYAGGQATGWLTATLNTASVPIALTVQPTVGALPDGTYQATVVVTAANASNSPQSIAITFTVTSNTIVLSGTSVPFSASVGGANPALQTVDISNSGTGTLSGLTVAVSYGAGQTPGWLTTATLSQTSAPAVLSLRPTVGTLAVGTYTATVAISSPVATNSPQNVTVTLVVTNLPVIALSANTASFTGLAGGPAPSARTIDITNAGAGTLTGLAVAVSYQAGQTPGWLTTAALSSATANATLTLQPTVGALAAGTYNATVAVTAPGTTNSPQNIAVTFTVATSPSIGLSRTTVPFAAVVGGVNPVSQTVNITNAGTGTLSGLATAVTYQAGQPTGWLTPTLSGTSGTPVLTLQPTTGALPVGTFTATVAISSPVANNSPQNITVTFVVAGNPLIILSTSVANFSGTAGSPSPQAQTVTISNGGSGTLNQLSTTTNYANGQPTGWLAAALNTTTAQAILTLTPTTGVLPAGTYSATVSVLSPAATNSPQFVLVTFVVASSPTIALSASARTFQSNFGSPPPVSQTVTITNSGSGSLTGLNTSIVYGAGQPTGWLNATLSTTTATSTLTLQPLAISPAQGGVFTATVSVASPVASNSPRTITVTYTVMVSWATDIYPTISVPANCLNCHFAGAATDLSSAQLAYNNLVNRVTTSRAGYPLASSKTVLVVPGNASASYLLDQVLKSTGAFGMPTSGSMSSAWISRLREWINLGAPNN